MQKYHAQLTQTSTVGLASGQVQITGLRPIDAAGLPLAKIPVEMLPVPVTDATVVVIRVTNSESGEQYQLPFSFTTKPDVPGRPVNHQVTLAFASHPDHHRLTEDLGAKEIRLIVEIQ